MKTACLMLLFASSLFAQKVAVEMQVYVGSYDATEAGSVIISLPEGKLTPSYGPSVAEEIQKTFHLKTLELISEPRIVTEVKVPAQVRSGSQPPINKVPREIYISANVLSFVDNLAHVQMEFSADGKPAAGAEFTAKAGQPVTLSSRLDGHLIFLICTISSPEQKSESLPRLTNKCMPVFPEELKKEKKQGMVVLNLRIDEKGKVLKCEKAKADDDRFVAPACEAAMKWEFEPGKKDGKPIAMDYFVTMSFKLE